MMNEDRGRVRVLFIFILVREIVLWVPCGPSCSNQPLSFCLVVMLEANITGIIIFWVEIGTS